MTAKIELFFSRDQVLALERVRFSHQLLGTERLSVRGKLGGAWGSQFTFQWTPAVQALMLLLLDTRLNRSEQPAILSGGAGSPAASLDYAIGKQPAWLLDIFGLDSHGVAIIRRLIRRTNPERKRGGDVELSVNPRHLGADQIRCLVNGTEVTSDEDLRALRTEIEKGWRQTRPRLAVHRGHTPAATAAPAVTPLPRLLIGAFNGVDPRSDAWGEWLAGNIARELAALPSLRVVSGQAVVDAEALQSPAALLGAKLRCALVLFGHTAVGTGEVRISMQLVAVNTGEVVWSHSVAAPEQELQGMLCSAIGQVTAQVTGAIAAAA